MNNGSVGRQNFLFLLILFYFILFIYLFFFDWREKSQPWTQVSINKSVEERKN